MDRADVSLPGLPSAMLFNLAQSSGRKAMPLFFIINLVHFSFKFGSSDSVESVLNMISTACAEASSGIQFSLNLDCGTSTLYRLSTISNLHFA
jgi:hypothetical protein